MSAFPPITHVAVTVTDLERSTRWYSTLLGCCPSLILQTKTSPEMTMWNREFVGSVTRWSAG